METGPRLGLPFVHTCTCGWVVMPCVSARLAMTGADVASDAMVATPVGLGQESAAREQAGRRPGRAHRGHYASGLQRRRPLPALQLQGPDCTPLGHPQGD